MTEEEEFFAWLDGELDSGASARVEARVAADPALAEQAQAHRALGRKLRGAFEPLLAAPVPDHIAAPPIDFLAARKRSSSPRFGIPQWAAMAATLALGIGLGTVAGDRGGAPIAIEGGRMVAAAALGQALDTQLASAGQPSGKTRIGLSFRDRNNALCRSFEGEAATGLACRDGEQWRIEGIYGADGPAASDYRMAAGSDPRLAALIEATIAGEPLDAAGERAALANGWR